MTKGESNQVAPVEAASSIRELVVITVAIDLSDGAAWVTHSLSLEDYVRQVSIVGPILTNIASRMQSEAMSIATASLNGAKETD